MEQYNTAPEPQREYTKSEKAANWWHYHWKLVVILAAVAVLGIMLIKDTVFQTKPDVQIGYVGTQSLPNDTVEALQQALLPYCSDLNGDGKVIVQVNQYTVDFSGDGNSADAYYQMAGVTQLSAEITDGNTFIFIMQDPRGFEWQTGALRYLDGTQPEDPNETDTANWREMVYQWKDCPVLAGLDLGQYNGYTIMDSEVGENQDVLANLYIGCRGVWNEKQQDRFADGEALWDALTAGAQKMGD